MQNNDGSSYQIFITSEEFYFCTKKYATGETTYF